MCVCLCACGRENAVAKKVRGVGEENIQHSSEEHSLKEHSSELVL